MCVRARVRVCFVGQGIPFGIGDRIIDSVAKGLNVQTVLHEAEVKVRDAHGEAPTRGCVGGGTGAECERIERLAIPTHVALLASLPCRTHGRWYVHATLVRGWWV